MEPDTAEGGRQDDNGRPPLSPPSRGEQLTALFLDMVAAERGGAANTIEAYARDLEDLTCWLTTRGRTLSSVATADLRTYLAALAGRGLAASSVARKLSAIRQLYRFLLAEGYRGDDPAAILEGPRRARPLPRVLSIAEVDRLIAAARRAVDAQQEIGRASCRERV